MIRKKLLVTSLSLTGLILLVLVTGKIGAARRFTIEATKLFSQSKDISGKIFYYKQIAHLPEPVKANYN